MTADTVINLGSFLVGALGAIYGAWHRGRRQAIEEECRRSLSYCRRENKRLEDENLRLMQMLMNEIDGNLDRR